MAIVPTPTVMKPQFSPTATACSLAALLVSIAGTILALPGSVLTDFHVPPADAQIILDVCLAITTLAGTHLSVSRSLLPSVDNAVAAPEAK